MTSSFLGWFALTVVLLGCVALTGLLRRRKLHVALVLATVASLAVTIHFAFELGKLHDLRAAGWITPFHLTLAKVATFALLLPVLSGMRTWFRAEAKRVHRNLAFLAIALTLAAAITGFVMIANAPLYSP